MPNYRTVFPSKYMKAEDLGATRPIGTIASVEPEDIGAGQDKTRKLVVCFVEPTLKPLALNRINCDTIAELAGSEDYETWPGCRIQLFATKTEFQGKRVPCIRICAPIKIKPPAARKPAKDDDADAVTANTEDAF